MYKTWNECPQTIRPNKKGSRWLPFAWHIQLHAVFLTEFLDAAGSVNNLLLARIEGVTLRTHFDAHVLAGRGAGLELIAATARYVDFSIVWMNFGLHAVSLSKRSQETRNYQANR